MADETTRLEAWTSGDAYEQFMGRWSALVAREFVAWLGVETGARWLDIGCGGGALTRTILELASPAAVLGVDPSPEFTASARRLTDDRRAQFAQGDAAALPCPEGDFDAVVAGLVLNFVPNGAQALAEMQRVARTGGVVAAYVWDYGERMQMLRYFWDAASFLDLDAIPLDEGRRFPLCRPEALSALFASAGLVDLLAQPLDVPTVFQDFEDYWTPFLAGQGPGPAYVARLTEARRSALTDRLTSTLPVTADGAINLTARAWAVRGTVATR